MGRRDEKRGVAGVHVDDHDFPKKCGHLENKVIIDRADSRAVLGYEEAGQVGGGVGGFGSPPVRRRKSSNIGTVKSISPCAGL